MFQIESSVCFSKTIIMFLTLTRFQVMAFLLLICKFVQDYSSKLYFDLIKEDIDHKNVPETLPEDHFIIVEKIIIDSLLYASIVSSGFLFRGSFDESLNKLLALMLLGSCLLVMTSIASCSLLVYNSFGKRNEVLKIFSVVFTFCSKLLFFFKVCCKQNLNFAWSLWSA